MTEKIHCLLAVEKEASEIIKLNLEKHKDFTNFEFSVCNNAQDLLGWSTENIDVLLLSRFLPGEDAKALLSRLMLMFPTTHIILLAGTESEQRRIYIEQAAQHGLTNVVTGKLPGDRPYTIFTALKEATRSSETEEYLVWDTDNEEEISHPNFNIAKDNRDKSLSSNPITENKEHKTNLANFFNNGSTKEPFGMPSAMPNVPHNFIDNNPFLNTNVNANHQGVLVVPSANKGGVGKTTVAITLAIALAEAGVSTVLLDYDFGSPDVATFFNLQGIPGIEALSGRTIRQGSVEELLVKVQPNLMLLPGPMNKTIPAFDKDQPIEIINILLQMFSVVVCDTPPEFWTRRWLSPVFTKADFVLAVVDQSKFSQVETMAYAPYMLAMGARPENIRIVLNRFNPRLHNPKQVEKLFCAGFKKNVKTLPRVAAVIPEDWEGHVKNAYKGEAAGLNDNHSQWHKLAEEIALRAGVKYQTNKKGSANNKGFLGKLFSR